MFCRCLMNSNSGHSTEPSTLVVINIRIMEICHTKTRTVANQKSKLAIDRLEPIIQTPEGQMLLNRGMKGGEVIKLQQGTSHYHTPVTKCIIKTKVYPTISFSFQNHMKSKTDMVGLCISFCKIM